MLTLMWKWYSILIVIASSSITTLLHHFHISDTSTFRVCLFSCKTCPKILFSLKNIFQAVWLVVKLFYTEKYFTDLDEKFGFRFPFLSCGKQKPPPQKHAAQGLCARGPREKPILMDRVRVRTVDLSFSNFTYIYNDNILFLI